ncbi:MAG TPA: hypothetical protein DCX53_06235, partial [Anaerolineae bacterium]|nr:hypothetical protein [Anaerolineae bacterium]
MSTKFHISLFIVLPLLLNSCGIMKIRGSGNVLTETRDVKDFDRVVITGTNELILTQGLDESLTVTADDNLMDHIESEVKNGTLYIGNMEEISPSQPIQFKLTVKEITGLHIGGIVNVEAGDIVTERLDIDVSGISTLSMGKLETETLAANLSGSTKIELTGQGKAVTQAIVLSGSNTYSAPGLRSQKVDISASGSNDVTVWSTDFMNIEMSGNGKIYYYGSP